MPSRLETLTLCAGVGFLLYSLVSKKPESSRFPLPPGPKGKPIIGILSDLPKEEQWLKITEWAHEHGEVMHMNLFGVHLVYLNSFEAAIDLLESRSSIYSDRPVSQMFKLFVACTFGRSDEESEENSSIELDKLLAAVPYGDTWRLQRRIFHQGFNSNTADNFKDIQLKHVHAMLRLFLEHPEDFSDHVKHFSSGVILESVYGIPVQEQNDPYVRSAEAVATAAEAAITGAYLVELLPFLRHIPDWIPGATFKKKANSWKKHVNGNTVLPFSEVSRCVANGNETPSMTASWIHKIEGITDRAEAERLTEAVMQTAGTALIAGYETTSSTVTNFLFLMALHPEVQKKAQKELDDHVGQQRLPDFSDQENLSYVNAIFKEVIRWFPILPLGFPHVVTTEDEYKGMRIPKGATVFPNAWAMSRDEKMYGPDADAFRPERFIEAELRNPREFVFGFGRRICPGRYVAENSVFLAICTILHAFNISKSMDEEGREIPIEARWVSGLGVHLEPFVCSIKPRFQGAETLIRSTD